MTVTEIQAKSLLRRYKHIDSWFICAMGMNLYRGCTHGCAYCDGRAEQYRLSGTFGKDIEVKINAPELLKRALDPRRKRVPLPGGFVTIGGGVTDAWQPIDQKYRLADAVLEILRDAKFPVHALTKSDRVVESLPLLKEIHEIRRAIVSFSFSSVDESISRIVEPGLTGPTKRLEAMRAVKAAGLGCGMFLMPVIPGLTDTPEMLTQSLTAAKSVGADYVVFGGMTLKPGRQHEHFMSIVETHWPKLTPGYRKVYPGNRWGMALPAYYDKLHRRLAPIARDVGVPLRIPDTLFRDVVSETEKVIIILEHLDYLTRLTAPRSSLGPAARSIRNSKKEIRELLPLLPSLRGVGPATLSIVREILDTGTSSRYRESLGLRRVT